MEQSEKIIFVLRDGSKREAKPDEVRDNRIPPDVSEVIFLNPDGTKKDNFFPNSLC